MMESVGITPPDVRMRSMEKNGSDLDYKIMVNASLMAQGRPEKYETWRDELARKRKMKGWAK